MNTFNDFKMCLITLRVKTVSNSISAKLKLYLNLEKMIAHLVVILLINIKVAQEAAMETTHMEILQEVVEAAPTVVDLREMILMVTEEMVEEEEIVVLLRALELLMLRLCLLETWALMLRIETSKISSEVNQLTLLEYV